MPSLAGERSMRRPSSGKTKSRGALGAYDSSKQGSGSGSRLRLRLICGVRASKFDSNDKKTKTCYNVLAIYVESRTWSCRSHCRPGTDESTTTNEQPVAMDVRLESTLAIGTWIPSATSTSSPAYRVCISTVETAYTQQPYS
jgi:hypothetical protein